METSFPFWPVRPEFAVHFVGGLLAFAGLVFTIFMLIDCLKRTSDQFAHPISKNAEYDKVIWAVVMVASLMFYFIGTIVYFFVVYMAKKEPSNDDSQQGGL